MRKVLPRCVKTLVMQLYHPDLPASVILKYIARTGPHKFHFMKPCDTFLFNFKLRDLLIMHNKFEVSSLNRLFNSFNTSLPASVCTAFRQCQRSLMKRNKI